MADENELEMDDSGKKKKLIIIIAIVVVLLAGGAGAFFMMGGEDEVSQEELDAALDSAEVTEVVEEPTSAAELGSAIYVPMPRPFRFNVPGVSRDRFVEIRVQLMVRGSDNEEVAKKHVPLIESILLTVFSQANADELASSAGKTSLKQKAITEVQKTMAEIEDSKVVEKVLFTGFVMQ